MTIAAHRGRSVLLACERPEAKNACKMIGAFGVLPNDVLQALLPLLPPTELAALSAASLELAQAAEPQWRVLFQTAYARSLLALRRQLPSWRQRFGARAVARRTELLVNWGGRGGGEGATAAAPGGPCYFPAPEQYE